MAARGSDVSKVYGNSRYHKVPVAETQKPGTVSRELAAGASGFALTDGIERSYNSKRSFNSKSS